MKSKLKINTILTLDEDEAKWLKMLMQNPLWVSDPKDENKIDKKMRKAFWNVLSQIKLDGKYDE